MGYILLFSGLLLTLACLIFYAAAKENNWFGYDMFDEELTFCFFIAIFFFLFLSWDGINWLITTA